MPNHYIRCLWLFLTKERPTHPVIWSSSQHKSQASFPRGSLCTVWHLLWLLFCLQLPGCIWFEARCASKQWIIWTYSVWRLTKSLENVQIQQPWPQQIQQLRLSPLLLGAVSCLHANKVYIEGGRRFWMRLLFSLIKQVTVSALASFLLVDLSNYSLVVQLLWWIYSMIQ